MKAKLKGGGSGPMEERVPPPGCELVQGLHCGRGKVNAARMQKWLNRGKISRQSL